jgi:plasmid stabilization system protein ParE
MPARIRVVVAPSAVQDLEEMLAWYAETGVPDIGGRLFKEILGLVEGLTRNPEMGRMVPEFGAAFLRELIHPPFRIVYRRHGSEIQVVRVWRSERMLRIEDDSVTKAHDSTGSRAYGVAKSDKQRKRADPSGPADR